MSNLVVVVFNDEVTAFEMRTALLKMQKDYLIELEDAVVVTRDAKGKTKLDQAVNLTSAGAVGGGFWGLLIGMIFLNPLLGAAVGASAGALSGKFTDIGVNDQMMKEIGQSFKPGSSGLFVADTEEVAAHALGLLRLHLARELDLIPDTDVFHWVVDFPLFKHDEETGDWTFMHHPFTAPTAGNEVWDPGEPQAVRGQHYDLVWNGWELGSGSIRIHDVEVQERVFKTMGMTDEEAKSKFGFLLDALAMGAPPHGGFAMGIERFVAQLAGEPDIRQIVAFPKVSSGSDPLTGAPTPMPDEVLAESGIRALPQEDPAKA